MNNFFMKKIKIVLLLFIVTVSTFAQKNNEYKTDDFLVEYPKNWRLDTSGQMNSTFILFSELKEEDLLNENINLLIQDLTNQGFTMKSYAKLSENQIKKMVPDGVIIKSKFSENKEHYEMIWSGIVSGRKLKFKQYFFLKGEKVYVLTLTTLPETYEEYISIGNEILNSFKLKNK